MASCFVHRARYSAGAQDPTFALLAACQACHSLDLAEFRQDGTQRFRFDHRQHRSLFSYKSNKGSDKGNGVFFQRNDSTVTRFVTSLIRITVIDNIIFLTDVRFPGVERSYTRSMSSRIFYRNAGV